MTKKYWEQTSSSNDYEWKAKAIECDRGLLEGIWGTETFKDNNGIEITEYHCLPRPSKQLIKDLKKLSEKYKERRNSFINKSIVLHTKELKGMK